MLVPAGSHRVRFHYFPSTLRWGLVVSPTALALILVYLVWGARSGAREGYGPNRGKRDPQMDRKGGDPRIDSKGRADHHGSA